jgi:hypothetical protein
VVAAAAYRGTRLDATMADAPQDPFEATDAALRVWRQGDVVFDENLPLLHLAVAGQPLTKEAELAAQDQPEGKPDDRGVVPGKCLSFVVLTQTCDLVRSCRQRPYAELAALIEAPPDLLREVQNSLRPAFAFLPPLADRRLVADLDRTMTVEKTVLASLARQPGVTTPQETAAFQKALSRNKARFAFPDAFVAGMGSFQKRLKDKAGKNSDEGRHVDALSEIRVAATPSWETDKVTITLWLIKKCDPDPAQWPIWIAQWVKLICQKDRYILDGEPRVVRPEDMRVSEYLASQQLDLDHLS